MTEVVDIAIVGAGVAGLAAAERATQLGLTFIILEATDSIGGRASSLTLPDGEPVDRGAHWLHQVPINPLVADAERVDAIASKPWQPIAGLSINGTWLSDMDIAATQEQIDDIEHLARDLAETGEDAPLAALIDPLFTLRTPLELALGDRGAGYLQNSSAVDVSRWARHDGSWPVATGLGRLIANRFADIPVRLNCPVQVIDWGSDPIRMDFGADLIEAHHVIVTASIGLLQFGGIQFAPELPETNQLAIVALEMTVPVRLVLDLGEPVTGFLAEAHILTTADRIPITFDLHLAGKSTALVTARTLGEASPEAVIARAATVFDRPANTISVLAVHDWGEDPWIRGGISTVPPGFGSARSDVALPIEDRLFIAGEATSRSSYGTVHGAMAEGIRVVERIAMRMGLLPEVAESRDTSSVFRFDY